MLKSIYFREPSGVLFELATGEPGFVFEPPERLGESLVLIGDPESRREELERRFPVLSNPAPSDYREAGLSSSAIKSQSFSSEHRRALSRNRVIAADCARSAQTIDHSAGISGSTTFRATMPS
jgi:hypothetical protein